MAHWQQCVRGTYEASLLAYQWPGLSIGPLAVGYEAVLYWILFYIYNVLGLLFLFWYDMADNSCGRSTSTDHHPQGTLSDVHRLALATTCEEPPPCSHHPGPFVEDGCFRCTRCSDSNPLLTSISHVVVDHVLRNQHSFHSQLDSGSRMYILHHRQISSNKAKLRGARNFSGRPIRLFD